MLHKEVVEVIYLKQKYQRCHVLENKFFLSCRCCAPWQDGWFREAHCGRGLSSADKTELLAHPQLTSLFMRGKVQVTHPHAVSGPHQALTLHPVTSASVG